MNETRNIAWKRLSVEVVAIVGSILLAFAIDAWWEDRNEVELERRLLTALLVEFENNVELLRDARTFYEQRYMDALRILEYLEQGATSLDHAEFEKSFRGLLIAGTLYLESGAHDGLLGSGNLGLIRDEELRNRLAAWPSYVREWSEEQDMVFSFVRTELVPYLSDSVRIRNIASSFAPFPDGESPPLVPAGANDAASVIDVSTSVEFDNLVYQRAQGLWYAMRDGETLLAQTTAIAELIRQNLEK
jgi:hypothetical protein